MLFREVEEKLKGHDLIVGVSADLEAQKIRDMIPSGFVELGELDYDYMLNNENVVKLKTKSIAYVNGYRVEIPDDTVVDIGKAPEKDAREDLLFLEVWKDEDFLKNGKVKWRIRFVDDVDFEKVWFQSNNGADKYIGLNRDGSEFSKILPQGGRETPLTMQEAKWSHSYQNRFGTTSSNIPINPTFSDVGLWSNVIFTGAAEENKERFKTLDGWVYAIPMFRLYRKPSCGKAIPFEYQKINPKVDYAKFANLMKEEKVERVISENIGGRSLVSLVKDGTSKRIRIDKNNLIGTTGREVKVLNPYLMKPNTTYTIVVNITEVKNATLQLAVRESSSNAEYQAIASKLGITKFLYTPASRLTYFSELFLFVGESEYSVGGIIDFKDLVFLEGDWTNKPLPKFFTGLKSLGEDEGNLIEVKTGILNESSYDKESVKTYQLDAPLRSLPNGVKDEIIGNKLIRRCGEVILDGDENWSNLSGNQDNDATVFMQLSSLENSKGINNYSIGCYSSNLIPLGATEVYNNQTIKSCMGINAQGVLQIRLLKSLLTTQDLSGAKAWLSKNPIKVIYELATPIEIPLKEVHSNTSNFTLQRQFNEGNWLRELPNGVKDTVENGKVVRRTKKVVLNGNEEWEAPSSEYQARDHFYAYMKLNDMSKHSNSLPLSDSLSTNEPVLSNADCATRNREFIASYRGTVEGNWIYISIAKTKLSSQNVAGFKSWLSQNPITVLYELAAPVQEALSTDNYTYCPCHEINTYCGSLYVGNGTNEVFVENGLGNDGVVIDTPFRSIKDKAIVEDCKYKKNVDGYEKFDADTKRYFENTESNDVDDLRHQVSLTGFNYDQILNESFNKLLRGEL